ncbi:uncharacterized protein EI90DRAFT_3098004 [Cantharellus anzutake]|uniref:uncharacterized protein n=1 Tax=Cantharellus anzutake TaxID=1750568 RepID=UPI001907D013|nr:uncharacterized protein EI90DRAFT_3098004 [Cantharellus anzutake]KAF8311127.1 hypothetical protein EI90DRAFT_3098004 [Cantharellus anzutake]
MGHPNSPPKIMSSSQRPQQVPGGSPELHPSNSATALEDASYYLGRSFQPDDNVDRVRRNLGRAWFTVHRALATDPNLKGRLRNETEFDAYVKPGSNEELELVKLLFSMANNQVPWSDLFKHEAFLKSEAELIYTSNSALATTQAWSGEFKGDLANVLFETIADDLSKDKTPYARLTTIINSSGTGKSRMVDELGKEIITVPMCLRPGIKGMPPPDMKLRDWLVSQIRNRDTVQKRLRGFLFSLLVVTLRTLKTIVSEKQDMELPSLNWESSKEKLQDYMPLVVDRQRRLASAFREHMTTGQLYHASGTHRNTFYDEVIKLADEFVQGSTWVKDEAERQYGWYVMGGKGLQEAGKGPLDAGESLCRFIDEHKILESNHGPRRPLVVLAFDEAHALTDNPRQTDWNLFSELRRTLRQIQDFPIFSIFLSTAGRFNKFSPEIRSDPSARVREPDNRPLNPISEISFDDLAYPALKDTVTIHRVVETDWISHLGRPLFGSYWDKFPDELAILDSARQKLLNGPNELRDDNSAGALACLSVRLALEFNTDVSAHAVSCVQVERHMRLCLSATAGFEELITIPGSEPLLAEAAYELMRDTHRNAVHHLANHSDLNCIDRGRRGELIATLLIMQTYDAAREISGRRWVSVANFMEALLPTWNYEMLLQSSPTSWLVKDGPKNRDNTFQAIFKDYGMWFNHVIKIETQEMISSNHLWKFVTRGAMILCATNQEGIDIVLPICHTTRNLCPDSMTAMVIQVKNAPTYKATLKSSLFDTMDRAVLFSTSDSDFAEASGEPNITELAEPKKKKRKMAPGPSVIPKPEAADLKPVIRVVFDLASPEPAVVFRQWPEVQHHFSGFTTFDIWLAGLSCKTFKQIQEADLESYQILLERSLMPHDALSLKDEPNVGEKARQGKEASRQSMVPLILPGLSHHGIHL